jgi:hypothetical protein
MQGNLLVLFLEGLEAVTPPGYSAGGWKRTVLMKLPERIFGMSEEITAPRRPPTSLNAFAGTTLEDVLLGADELFTSMPIGKMVVLGILPEEQIDSLIAQVNQAVRL